MEDKKTNNTWEKPELFIISNAELNESVLVASVGDDNGGSTEPPPWTR